MFLKNESENEPGSETVLRKNRTQVPYLGIYRIHGIHYSFIIAIETFIGQIFRSGMPESIRQHLTLYLSNDEDSVVFLPYKGFNSLQFPPLLLR